MGLLDKYHEHHAARQEENYEQELATWREQMTALDQVLATAREWNGELPEGPTVLGIVLKRGERVFMALQGSGLIESRRQPGHYSGGMQGMSFRITKGVYYRVGKMRGTYQPGPEEPTVIDQGNVVISSTRVIFAGQKQSREWRYDKLLGCSHAEDSPWTALQVSNRQKVSGFTYTGDTAHEVRFRLDLAIALSQGNREGFLRGLESDQAELQAKRPINPAPQQHPTPQASPDHAASTVQQAQAATATPQPLPPAGWYPDPSGSGERWWDGRQWTEQRTT